LANNQYCLQATTAQVLDARKMQRFSIYRNRVQASYLGLRRVVRVLQGEDLWQGAQIKCQRMMLGGEGACWCICPQDLSASSVVYSMGVGEDISFDLALIEHFGLELHAFDPTPRSIEWLQRQTAPREFSFHEYGVADFDGNCAFLPPENPAHVSHSIVGQESSRPAIEVPVHRLGTIMKMLGHKHIDLLKMDIEGAEYGVLADMLAHRIQVRQLLVEFHHRWPRIGIEKTRQAIHELNVAGYGIFSVSTSGEEYSFQRPVAG
jgi:FkbM family methyltransferase